MTRTTLICTSAFAALTALMPMSGFAQSGEDLMMSRLGTTEADPVLVEAMNRAAMPVTDEMRAKAIECWTNNACETGTGGEITVA